MHARVWQVQIQPGQIEAFTNALDSLLPAARQEGGFQGLLVLRADSGTSPEATVIGVWDSAEKIKASEKSLFLYQAIARVLSHCKGFPNIGEQEVLICDFRGR